MSAVPNFENFYLQIFLELDNLGENSSIYDDNLSSVLYYEKPNDLKLRLLFSSHHPLTAQNGSKSDVFYAVC